MSINSAMLAGVSGLVANSSALAAISDNIANVNTVGYKRAQVNFSDLVTSQAVQGEYSAGGVESTAINYVSQQGQVQSSTSPTDIALTGDGFFVVSQGTTGPNAATREFTRAGSFLPDANGYLKNTAGLYLLGWPINPDGSVTANPSDLTALQPINVANLASTVQASDTGTITANLNSDQAVSTGAATYNASTKSMAAGLTTPDYTMQMSVVDSLGDTHTIDLSFLKTGTNSWAGEVYAVPASDVTTGASGVAGQIASGSVKFNSDGTLDIANSGLFSSSGFSSNNPPTLSINWASSLGLGSTPQTVAITMTGQSGGLTQLAGPNGVKTSTTNGAGIGNVAGVAVGSDGIVTATFDNGQTRPIAQLAVATFPNPDGLKSASGNAYSASIASGQFALNKPGDDGAATVDGGALESSTVDLSTEFTSLITTQRAYSASSKIITTADEMLQDLLDTIR